MDAPWALILRILAFLLFLIAGMWFKAAPEYYPHRLSLIAFGLASGTLSFIVH